MIRRLLASAIALAFLGTLTHPARAAGVSLTKYGTDTPAMQRVLDEESAVHCPSGTHTVTQTLRLHTGQTFTLDPACTLRWSGSGQSNAALLDTTGAADVSILGAGLLDGATTPYTVGLLIGTNTHRLTVEDLRIAHFGSLAGAWGTWGDGVYLHGGGPVGSSSEASTPSDIVLRRVTISHSARNGISWLQARNVTMDRIVISDTGGRMTGSDRTGFENVPGAGIDIEPSVVNATGPPIYPVSGTLTSPVFTRNLYGLTVYGADWDGPIKISGIVCDSNRNGCTYVIPPAADKVVFTKGASCGRRGYRPCR